MPTERETEAEGKSTPLAETVLSELLQRIYDGRLAQGVVINEAAIAEEFGVSRGPVREAVRRLQGLQLITREPYVKSRVVTLTQDGAQELFEMRLALEGMACRLAAERMSDDEIADLIRELEQDRQRTLAGKAKAKGQSEPRVFDFHERIVRGSRNSRIIDALCGDLYHLLRMYRRQSGAVPERKDQAYAEHWQIVRALRARDGELAESLMRSHVGRASAHLFDKLPLITGTSAESRSA
ncbi:GntR family transcriptional regulator [Ramlibacter sp. G-1-2-2]|uniref:GntR family transcriptional regulator n=1 Tax=Ramlibacter agri TaxID=2728837 RepID=A0A848HDM1_9BURK|nr:GntR family transcriptional regulator [Ramlibacter agri]NML47569.1 GntR family transcriptional regulator [Ramlibacter agri]